MESAWLMLITLKRKGSEPLECSASPAASKWAHTRSPMSERASDFKESLSAWLIVVIVSAAGAVRILDGQLTCVPINNSA